jgi:predicted metal-dependent HD superfamily phosphohydrolase
MSKNNLLHILLHHWENTLKPFNVDPMISNKAFFQLVSIYSHPSRYYHSLQHIHSVLTTIDILNDIFKPSVQDLSSVQLAAWFHDVVYNTQIQDNEEKSAEYAAEMLKNLAIPVRNITKIQHLILCTKNHQADDIDSQVLLDADLAILAADAVQYQEYSQAIRQEYAWVSEAEYIAGRRKILESFLQRPSIYFTPFMLEYAEELARLNISTELKNQLTYSRIWLTPRYAIRSQESGVRSKTGFVYRFQF